MRNLECDECCSLFFDLNQYFRHRLYHNNIPRRVDDNILKVLDWSECPMGLKSKVLKTQTSLSLLQSPNIQDNNVHIPKDRPKTSAERAAASTRKTNAEICKAYRDRKNMFRIQTPKLPPKSSTQRWQDFKKRKNQSTKTPKSSAERCKAYRERQKLLNRNALAATQVEPLRNYNVQISHNSEKPITQTPKLPPKSSAERCKAYRDRKKLLKHQALAATQVETCKPFRNTKKQARPMCFSGS